MRAARTPAAESPDEESWDDLVARRKHEPVKFSALGAVVTSFFDLLVEMKAVRDRQVSALEARVTTLEARPATDYKGVWTDSAIYAKRRDGHAQRQHLGRNQPIPIAPAGHGSERLALGREAWQRRQGREGSAMTAPRSMSLAGCRTRAEARARFEAWLAEIRRDNLQRLRVDLFAARDDGDLVDGDLEATVAAVDDMVDAARQHWEDGLADTLAQFERVLDGPLRATFPDSR